MMALRCVTMQGMNTQIYNMAVTAASAIWANPLITLGFVALVLAIVTGVAGRLSILCEDLRCAHFLGRNR
jgi:hypothetical protein